MLTPGNLLIKPQKEFNLSTNTFITRLAKI